MSKQLHETFAATTLTLSDEEANAYTREVEAVQPCLHVEPDMFSVLTPFPLQDTLGDRGNGRVVPTLDVFEKLRETFVVILYFRRPLNIVGIRIVSCSSSSTLEPKKKKKKKSTK